LSAPQAGTASIPETAFLHIDTSEEQKFLQKSTSGRFGVGTEGEMQSWLL
jgi:hypothetical protein